MAMAFRRTLRALQADSPRRHILWLVIAGTLLSAWETWFFFGELTLYEISDRAFLEAEVAAHPVAAQVSGRVLRTSLTLGKEVRAGDVLVELDAAPERLSLEEARAGLAGLREELRALQLQLGAEGAGIEMHRQVSMAALEEAGARVTESEAHARFAAHRIKSLSSLRGKNVVSDEHFRQAQAEADSSAATVQALTLAVVSLELTQLLERIDREARRAEIERELAEVAGKAKAEEANIRRLEHQVDRRIIRATINGRVGQTGAHRVGSVVDRAEFLGAIIPPGRPRAVAYFPVAGVGRIQPGQPARLRLEGFPWTQYGLLEATVSAIGNEPAGGQVRVELALIPASAPDIPVQHGLSGTAEIEVEHLSPAKLVMRTVGQRLTHSDVTLGTTRAGAGPS